METASWRGGGKTMLLRNEIYFRPGPSINLPVQEIHDSRRFLDSIVLDKLFYDKKGVIQTQKIFLLQNTDIKRHKAISTGFMSPA